MARLPLPLRRVLTLRRGLFALLVTAVAAVAAGGSLGFALAADDVADSASPIPTELGLAEPRVGDRGTFNFSIIRKDRDAVELLEPEKVLAEFEWLPNTVVRDADGNLRAVRQLRYGHYQYARPAQYGLDAIENDAGGRSIVFLDAATGAVLAETNTHARSEQTNRTGLLPISTQINTTWDERNVNFVVDDNDWWTAGFVCGFLSPLQGTRVALGDRMYPFRNCNVMVYGMPGEKFDFRPVGTATVAGYEAVALSHTLEGVQPGRGWSFSGYEVHAWLSEAVPYALRIEAAHGMRYPDALKAEHPEAVRDSPWAHYYTVIRLASFVRGDGASVPAPPVGDAAPALEWAPREVWGPNDDGIDHPWRLSDAFRRTREDPNYGKLRDYLNAHPNAITLSARYDENRRDDALSRRWTFDVGDGASGVTICAYKNTEWPVYGSLPTTLPVEPPVEDPLTRENYTYQDCPWREIEFPVPLAPERLPTVASVWARWRAYASPDFADHAPNFWSFRLLCTHGGCEAGTFEMEGGHASDASTWRVNGSLVPWTASASNRTFSTIEVDPSGRTRWMHEGSQRTQTGAGGDPPPPEVPQSGGPEAVPLSVDHTTRLWQLPTGAYAAGVGGVALLAGLAYWLWPAVKGGLAIPLFSRVERPTALRHPVRAELHQLIEATPGIHFQELSRRTGRGRGTIQHHLRKLVDVGLVNEQQAGGFTCYFPKGVVDRRLMETLPLLKSEGSRGVLAAIAARPGLSGSDVAAVVGLTRQTVNHHVWRLETSGLIEARRAGRQLELAPTELGRAALIAGTAA